MKTKTRTASDSDILVQSVGKPWLFSILVGRYEKAFLRKSLRILHSRESAEDAVQETFLKIYKHASQFSEQPKASFNSWAYKILIHTCYDEVARRNKSRQVENYDFADLDQMGFSSEYLAEESADRSSVQSVMSRMPVGLSRFLRLYFFEYKSQKQIAREEQMSLSAVRSRIHRAKKNFKSILLKTI